MLVGQRPGLSSVKFLFDITRFFPSLTLMCCTLVTLLIFLLTNRLGPYRICADDSGVWGNDT
jgi:hypothetical protein